MNIYTQNFSLSLVGASLSHTSVWALSPPPCGLLHHLWVGCSISGRLFSTTGAWVLSTHSKCGFFTNFLEIPKSKPQHLIRSIYLTFCLLNQTCDLVLLEWARAKPVNELTHGLLFGVGRHPISQSLVFNSLVIYWETNPPPSLTGSSVSVFSWTWGFLLSLLAHVLDHSESVWLGSLADLISKLFIWFSFPHL